MAEDGKLKEALELFTSAISLAPNRPSLFNNRAQAYRLMGDDDGQKIILYTIYKTRICFNETLHHYTLNDGHALISIASVFDYIL